MIYRRALISELQNTAGGAFTVLFSIVVTIGLVQILNQTAGGRYDSNSILEIVAYSSLVNLPPLITLALFLAVFMTLNRSWRDSEMFVWFSAGGCSLATWIRPVLRFSIPIVILVGLCSLVISPWSRAELAAYKERFAQRDDVTRLSSGQFIEAKSGKQIFFLEAVDQDNKTVERVFMAEPSRSGAQTVVSSKKGRIEEHPNGDRYVVLNDGKRYEVPANGQDAQITDFGTYELRLDTSPSNVKANLKVDSMQLPALLALVPTNKQAVAELFWRINWPIVAVILALLGIPLSYTNPRALKYYGQTAAVLFFILYLNCLSIFKTWIIKGVFDIWSATIVMNLPFIVLAIFLFYRLMTMNTRHIDTIVVNWVLAPFRKLKSNKKEQA
ncbi:LPS export ABC transporter permease LptF [Turicimonas sp. TL08]